AGAGAVERVAGHLDVVLPRGQRGPVHFEIGADLVDLLANCPVLDLRNGLPARDGIAQLDVDRLDASRDAGHDLDGRFTDEVADHRDVVDHLAAVDGADLDRHRHHAPTAATAPRTARAGAATTRGSTSGRRRFGGARSEVPDTDAHQDDDRYTNQDPLH